MLSPTPFAVHCIPLFSSSRPLFLHTIAAGASAFVLNSKRSDLAQRCNAGKRLHPLFAPIWQHKATDGLSGGQLNGDAITLLPVNTLQAAIFAGHERAVSCHSPTQKTSRFSSSLPCEEMVRKEFLFCSVYLLNALVHGDLQVGFYTATCPQAELIIQSVVQIHFSTDPSVAAALLRMHFHDCFVRGCDASILIDSTKKKKSEKAAVPNLTVRGFEIIDQAKAILEAQCPSTVSCADIIAIATRDAVALAGGPRYDLPTGRRDGLVSSKDEVILPGPASSVSDALQLFTGKGLMLKDMVALLGGHTLGVAHCSFFQDRLFNFQGTGAPDPTMDPVMRAMLSRACGANLNSQRKDPTVFLDQSTPFMFDNVYYRQLLAGKGILQIDQELATDNSTAHMTASFAADGNGFLQKFAKAMVKLGSIDILIGNVGEIRKNCRTFNPPATAT